MCSVHGSRFVHVSSVGDLAVFDFNSNLATLSDVQHHAKAAKSTATVRFIARDHLQYRDGEQAHHLPDFDNDPFLFHEFDDLGLILDNGTLPYRVAHRRINSDIKFLPFGGGCDEGPLIDDEHILLVKVSYSLCCLGSPRTMLRSQQVRGADDAELIIFTM
jgi:hypothetical protein